METGTLERYQTYIENLYNVTASLQKKDFVNKTGWKDFVPVVDDDALFPVMNLDAKWNDQVEPMRRFNRLVVDSPELNSTLLPIGDGMIVAVKK